jgi:hypothetical protein
MRNEDKQLNHLLVAAVVVVELVLFSLLVLSAILVPVMTETELDTTLVLGLGGAILTSLPIMLGVTVALRGKE